MKSISLSPIEKSFYYQTKLNASDDSGNIVHKVVFDDTVRLDGAKKIFSTMMSNNTSLRYKLIEEDGTPYFLDSGTTLAEESVSLDALKRPFDLQRDILLRYIVDGNTIFIASHHIIFDAISWNLFIEEFLLLTKSQHPPEATQDKPVYSHTPRDDSTDYWVNQLSDADRLVSIQKSDDSTGKRSVGVVSGKLQRSATDELRLYARSSKISLNTIFMYAVSILLYRLTEQDKMVISTPISTRELSDKEVHCDINVLPCPIAIDSDALISEGLLDFSNAMWRNIEKRNFSLLELTKTLGADGMDGLYNVMVEYSRKQTVPGIISDTLINNKTPKMDIVVSAEDFNDDVTITIEYDKTKVGDIFADIILSKIEKVLGYIVPDRGRRIFDIELNSPQEIKDLLLLGGGKEVKLLDVSIIDRFLRQVSNDGGAIAIRQNGQECSYEELSQKAEAIAAILFDVGVTSQDKVGIYMERSIEYIATMLAIWMLNAVYVPLDISNPDERNQFFLKQADVSTVVTNGREMTLTDCTVVDVANIQARNSNVVTNPISVDDAAYVIFTSGSTGTPKGITIKHGGFLNHLDIMVDELSLSKDDVIAQTAPASFDISVWQLTCGFTIGATIEIIEQNLLVDVDAMYLAISNNSVSVLEIVPSLLSAYLDAESTDASLSKGLSCVKVITTGEAITNDIAQKWVGLYPNQPLINAYGPAEASDDTHFYNIDHDSLRKYSSIPIGRTLRNIHTYILDADQKLSPNGVVGEIAIGGVAVADGYVNDQARTELAFTEDTFVGTGKMYRTGDYGRWLPDGNLAYNGRRDNQIKIRGQRFELGEIENNLKALSEVKDAAVIVYDYGTNKRIVGFVSVDDSNRHKENHLKTVLSQKLPQYMIPWRIVDIDTIPRNNNGKTDRHRLTYIAKSLESNKETTQNDGLLSTIISVYSEVLKRNVDVDTNYFEAGGDSLLSIKIVSRLKAHGLSVSVRDVIANQTPVELAQVVEMNKIDEDNICVPDNFMSAIQKKYILESGDFADYGEVQVAVLNDKKLTTDNISQVIEKVHDAYEQLGMIKLTDVQEISSYDEINPLVEKYRMKLKLHDHMAISVPIRVGRELGILFIIHHYIFDIYSWEILRNDIDSLLSGRDIPDRNNTKLLRYFLGQGANDILPSDRKSTSTNTYDTKRHSFKLAAPRNVELLDDGMLSIYAIAQAIMQLLGKNFLLFGIERSARIDSRDYDLSNTIGWATYIKQVSISKDDSLNAFKERFSQSVASEDDTNDINIIINYLGQIVHASGNLRIIDSTIYKTVPFIEVDIELNDGMIIYNCQYNIGVKDEDIVNIAASVENVLDGHNAEHSLDDIQQSSILERIKLRAGRD